MEITETHSDYNGFGVSCNGANNGSIDVTVTGGAGNYSYSWSSGQETEDVSELTAGTYTLTVTDDNGCQQDISVEIKLILITQDLEFRVMEKRMDQLILL